jgi:hypothetical protein
MEQNTVQNKEGRPLKFASVEELQGQIDKYFQECDNRKTEVIYKGVPIMVSDPRPYTVTGLAVALDTSRDVLIDYESGKYDDPEKSKDENSKFSNTIKKAKLKIQNYAEESLWQPKIATGVIFNLKNNWGWIDKQVVETKPPEGDDIKNKLKEIDDKLSMVANSKPANNTG